MNRLLEIVLCFLLPPVAAALKVGITKHFWINLLLTILTIWTLGIIHALWLTFEEPAPQHV